MRKFNITAIMLAVIMTLSLVGNVYANDTVQLLSAIGIAPTTFINSENKNITRAELAYMAVKTLDNSELSARDTAFVDVTKNVLYSGYVHQSVNLGLFSGVSQDTFQPNGGVTLSVASKVIIKLLGLESIAEEKGGYPQGYLALASQLHIDSGITDGVNLTRYEVCKMFYNILLETSADLSCTSEGIQISKSKENGVYLADKLGYNSYKGKITEINKSNNFVSFQVEKNNHKDNKVKLTAGQIVSFAIAETLDIGDFENLPVNIWVNNNEEIVYVSVQKGYGVKYGYISAVNGDYSEDNAYKASAINRMSFIDDDQEYDISKDALFYYNGILQTGAEKIAGRFIRAIVKNDEIIALYIWNLSDDCLVTQNDTTQNTISYIRGIGGIAKLRELDSYTKTYVYIDGRRAEIDEIKPNSVLRYYMSGDLMLMSVTEKNIIGILQSIAENYVTIGRTTYHTADVYFNKSGLSYKRNGLDNELSEILGDEVQGFLSPNGNLVYIKNDGDNSITDFYGVVYGIKRDVLTNEAQIFLKQIGASVEGKTYVINKFTEYESGINLDVLESTAKAVDGSCVYLFSVNKSGKIKKIKKPTSYAGYGTSASLDFTSFYNDTYAYLYINNLSIYFTDSPITAVYQKNGEFCAEIIKWSQVKGMNSTGPMNIKFFSENEEASSPELVLLSGAVENLMSVSVYHGVVTGRRIKQVNDESHYIITVEALGGKKEYVVKKSTYETLPENAFIAYQLSPLNQENIYISTVMDWSAHSDQWVTSNTAGAGLFKGQVRQYANNRLVLQGYPVQAYYVHPEFNFIIEVNEGNPNKRFKATNANEINVGDTVYYNLYGGEIRGIFVIR